MDLPPGIVARLDIDPGRDHPRRGAAAASRLEVSGGLGGLLIDTRPSLSSCPAAASSAERILEAMGGAGLVGQRTDEPPERAAAP